MALLRVLAHILLRLIKAILPRLLHPLLLVPRTNTVVDFNRMAAIMVEEGSITIATISDSAPGSMITRAVITITIITTRSQVVLLQPHRRTIRSLMPLRLERRRNARPTLSVSRPVTSPRTTLTKKPSSASSSAARFPSMFLCIC